MKVCTGTPNARRNDSLANKLRQLKSGQYARLTTAREVLAARGAYGTFLKEGMRLKLRVDGDDVLAWLEPVKP